MDLSDLNRLTIISRAGTAATVLAMGTLLATAGIGGAIMAISMGAGLASEQVLRWKAKQDREKVRVELAKTIQTAELEYAADVSDKLRANYNTIISNVKQHQDRWYRAQLEALAAAEAKEGNSGPDWSRLLQRIELLRGEVESSIGRTSQV